MQRRPPLQGGSSSSNADVVPPGCEAMAMVRRTLRRPIATLAATEAAALQQQVETTLLLFLTHKNLLKRGEGTERPSGPDTPMALSCRATTSAAWTTSGRWFCSSRRASPSCSRDITVSSQLCMSQLCPPHGLGRGRGEGFGCRGSPP